ncbi:MAG: anthranilate synthase component I [Rhodospirillaceae bacterium]|nr:anthranilate synthase component I [Rhodospirillaceae bacterium]
MHTPDEAAFTSLYRQGIPQVVSTTLVADLETTVSAYMKLADGQPDSMLFESVEGGATRGRYSFIALKPDLIWRCHQGEAQINRTAQLDRTVFQPVEEPPLDSLRALIAESRIALPPRMPPMASGLFGYVGYHMICQAEPVPDANPDHLGIPDALLVRPTIVAIFDTIEDVVTIVTPVWPNPGIDAANAYTLARERLAEVVSDLNRSPPYRRERPALTSTLPEPSSNMTREGYRQVVERAKAFIRAGDIFQVVPSQRFSVPFKLPPFALYRALRRLNPSPFLFFQDFGDFSVVGSSPEIMVRLRGEEVTIRPIAGTRPRARPRGGANREEDRAIAAELLADPKERAEHLMLLDLGRNDVGRIAEIGSVKVTDQFFIEYYSHVMHIVSNVVGKIRPGLTAVDALMAGFPAGTVSGAPKIRAMQIIDELEVSRRGLYAGAVGYFGASGDLDTCIALRTGLVKDGTLYVQAGGGIVYDSDPDAEYEETVNKAGALFRAADEAVRFASGRG